MHQSCRASWAELVVLRAACPKPHTRVCTHAGAVLLSSPGLWLGLLLDKALFALILFFLFKRFLP